MKTSPIAVLCAAALALSACTVPDDGADDSRRPQDGAVNHRATPDPRWEPLEESLTELVDEIYDEHDSVTGIVISDGVHFAAAGAKGKYSAWSTIKVPIAIAATRAGTADPSLIDLAITQSDNDASWMMWNSLGTSKEAALKVEEVLIDGDGPANVYDVVVNSYDSPTGNAVWPLKEQAQFATHLPCLGGAEETYEAMGEIVDWQSDGLGRLKGAHFKGGWSDEQVEGSFVTYTYRQFGVVDTDDGPVGIAVVAYPDDGSHETAAKLLDELARGVDKLIDADAVPASRTC